MDDLQTLQKQLGYQFQNKELLIEALTHKSYKQPYNNERLEFLGDAVLDLIVGEYLYKRFTHFEEGNLSKMRASLVNEGGFTRLAIYLNLGNTSIYPMPRKITVGALKALFSPMLLKH